MKVLVIGSGGREHALVWKIAQSSQVKKIYAASGNAGIAEQAQCVDISPEDIQGLLRFAKDNSIDLTIVGPELPLANGIVDEFVKEKLKIFGPLAMSARLESSKVFAKKVMLKAGVPTAGCSFFSKPNQAKDYIRSVNMPIVIKADGLAQGKGVVVAKTTEEAFIAISNIMEKKIFGDAGNQIIIEERLVGQEVSILAICDGEHILPLASSQDHKTIFDNDQGPNTGGMGAYSPTFIINERLMGDILKKIFYPIVEEMIKIGCPYKGVLYAGLMITEEGPKVLEFNVRFGDPETQVILPRLNNDLVEVIMAVFDRRLDKIKLSWDKKSCVCVVLSSGGYPGEYQKGKEIFGLDEAKKINDVIVFHAGTKREDSKIVTNGGRVLGVTALGEDIQQAINNAYHAVGKIKFENMHYRKDIGAKAIVKNS